MRSRLENTGSSKKYKVETAPRFDKSLKKLDPPIRKRVLEELKKLGDAPNSCEIEPLKYELKGLHSLHVNDYRAIIRFSQNKAHAVAVGPRRKIYDEIKRYLKLIR